MAKRNLPPHVQEIPKPGGGFYYYHRIAKRRLAGEKGSAEFLLSWSEAEKLGRTVVARRAVTIADLISLYKASAEYADLQASTRAEKDRLLKTLSAEFGTAPTVACEDPAFRGDLLDWRDRIASSGRLRESENRMAAAASLFAWAVDRGKVTTNPLLKWGRTYKNNRADMIWTPDHLGAFRAAASAEMDLALDVALYTGQRQGDLLRLMWTSYRNGEIVLRQSKGGVWVTIPCVGRLREKLDAVRDAGRRSTHILTTPKGKPWNKRNFSQKFARTTKAAGIAGLHFHDLRGTAVTALADAGCTVPEIIAITGHSLASATAILEKYMSRTKVQGQSAIAKLENHMRTQNGDGCKNG